MITATIVDDEPFCCESLDTLPERYCPAVKVLDICYCKHWPPHMPVNINICRMVVPDKQNVLFKKLLILFFLLLFFFSNQFAKAQFQIDKPALPIESLKKVLPSLHDSTRVD